MRKLAQLAVALCLTSGTALWCDTIYTSSFNYETAVSSSTQQIEEFSTFSPGQIITNGQTLDGVTYSFNLTGGATAGYLNPVANSFTGLSLGANHTGMNQQIFDPGDTVHLTFVKPITAFGAFFNVGLNSGSFGFTTPTANAFTGSSSYDDNTFVFAGIVSSTPFQNLTISSIGPGAAYTIPGFASVATPEPAASTLAVAGLFALALCSRRKWGKYIPLGLVPATLFVISSSAPLANAQFSLPPVSPSANIQHVLLISVDGMHALDFENCASGISAINGGAPYCPNLAGLAQTGIKYTQASTAKPSDSFPGSVALAGGASPRLSGVFYDVSYDRALSPPAQTTPYGIVGGQNLCPGTVGTEVGFDEQIDVDYTQLNGGGAINPNYLPRDPKNGCAPVYPHNFVRSNTMFEVIRANGGYTAWSDKHPAYDFYNGPSGTGVTDFYSPEINSKVIALPQIPGCSPVPDPSADLTAWTNSFQNIQCYDSIKVQTVVNWIDGLYHDGSKPTQVPNLFGMNFQAVSVGQKLVEKGVIGGYLDAFGTPSTSLLSEIEFVDTSIGRFIAELKTKGLFNSTAIIITAKHGQSPIDIHQLVRITGDTKANPSMQSPGSLLGSIVAHSSEDDVSLIWLTDQTKTAAAVQTLSTNLAQVGGGEVYSGKSLQLWFNDPATDSRTPDIIVTPNIGVVYTGGQKKVSEHGGFANDDTHVIMLVSDPNLAAAVNTSPVETRQVAPTVLNLLRINPSGLESVRKEGVSPLPGIAIANPFGTY